MNTTYKSRMCVSHPSQTVIRELSKAFEVMRKRYLESGIDYDTTDKPMDGYQAMQYRFDTDKHITISTVGNATAIYGSTANIAFRFWHDCVHCLLRQDFSYKGEHTVIMEQAAELRDYGISEEAMEVFMADTIGQVRYYYEHKEFVKDQQRFITTCLTQGLEQAVLIKQH
ncbi:hypothetical protein HOU78_gp53 [Vibrio phage 1.204.O._10N.222.46.F12]|uniref:Uncharacterized protein n=1 Tax=Vibrio phage 1.204.O._10N.222.46.F12 TaxID=1881263 RepID=A0A2I7RNP1_9CAUD|nr:hypothetical protein HOU78_gp53 [Vibrio phage 1.204.O._10N.222.46.F12]AUR95273.1 hypothetical protein NVP1204O_53 [Vibrio phage 1.204.O._10N.222.46.F12]